MTAIKDTPRTMSPADVARAYHARTKHTIERFAAGPETLDWDAQPNPFREFDGTQKTQLPLGADHVATPFAKIAASDAITPAPVTLFSIGVLMQLSFGLSAWKEYGPDRWALRCNPSSGNLHPTEAYLLARGVPDLDDGVYHYVSRDHVLEHRCRPEGSDAAPPQIWIGLSSVHWREAWKYGERAFRYCQLDIGHAVGAVCYAARALGWTAEMVAGISSSELAAVLGLDRSDDFAGAEREDADLLIAISPGSNEPAVAPGWTPDRGVWTGRANMLDRHPMYRWPIIDEVSQATQGGGDTAQEPETAGAPPLPPLPQKSEARAADLILGRRSAQRFDARTSIDAETFYHLLDSTLVRRAAPWNVWRFAPRLHLVVFVHRVEGLEPGVYALPRSTAAADALRKAMRDDFEWKTLRGAPPHLPLVRLLPANCKAIAKTISCHQAIASDGCFSLSMLGEFEPAVQESPWHYRRLHWEAGLIGQVLYLEAEAAGLRGTGIGCYFDDGLHSLLGITTTQLQALYHFTIGNPVADTRIMTSPAYPDRHPSQGELGR